MYRCLPIRCFAYALSTLRRAGIVIDLEHDSRLRLALKNVAPISALPGVVIEHKQRGVDLYVRLPSVFVGIARADPSHQRYPADVSQRRSPAFPESAAAAVGRVTLILCGAVDPGPPVRR